MIKIVKVPLQLEPFLKKFEDLFTKPSYCSFRDLCGALSVCDKSKTVANLCDTMADCNKGKKARSSYNWFLSDANWDENEVAQRKVDLFIDKLCLKDDDKILLIIDDTYNEKNGIKTDGVGRFYDHSKESYIWGNNFVTSVIQSKGLFIPHKAKMYSKNSDECVNFKTKLEIAFNEIIEPLKVPKGMNLCIVFDSWWSSEDLINKCINLRSVLELLNLFSIHSEIDQFWESPDMVCDSCGHHGCPLHPFSFLLVYLNSQTFMRLNEMIYSKVNIQ